MNSKPGFLNKRVWYALTTGALGLVLMAALAGCGLRGGQNNQPPAPPTVAPAQPTAAPAQPTAVAPQPPTAAPTEAVQPSAVPPTATVQSDPQGDELEQLLDQLDQENSSADPLDDVPQ
jgi:hypothetical protein